MGNGSADKLGAEPLALVRQTPARYDFDEEAYLRENPDVAFAIAKGELESGYAHYQKYGLREGRVTSSGVAEPSNQLIRIGGASLSPSPDVAITHFFEALIVSRGGGVLIVGWIDDAADPISHVRLASGGWRITFSGSSLGRTRRFDVEEALHTTIRHPYAYYGLVFANEAISSAGSCEIEITLSSGRSAKVSALARLVEDDELRDIVLSSICTAHHFGNSQVKAIEGFDHGAGEEILKLNRKITGDLIRSPYFERFGREGEDYDGSIVVCLYGRDEFLFLQTSLFGAVAGIGRYEFIFVSNSPELGEALLREARAANFIYGVDITVVLLTGNAGFGAANNVAVEYARSDRVLIVNPDVLPQESRWAERHSAIVRDAPSAQTKIFGAALYYDDGSLMHGGMYFEVDKGIAVDHGRHRVCHLMRVEHYGKGTPAERSDFVHPRAVPAVTGAFMSCDRGWFEKLGGFTQDYVFGHYEDADLCLKSLQAGSPVWMQSLKLWHLEGKGSIRLPVHEGGSLVNRWLFSATWGAMLSEGLIGPHPMHPAFRLAS